MKSLITNEDRHELLCLPLCNLFHIKPTFKLSVIFREFEEGDDVVQLKDCEHNFHRLCIQRWFQAFAKRHCPVCLRPYGHKKVGLSQKQVGMALTILHF